MKTLMLGDIMKCPRLPLRVIPDAISIELRLNVEAKTKKRVGELTEMKVSCALTSAVLPLTLSTLNLIGEVSHIGTSTGSNSHSVHKKTSRLEPRALAQGAKSESWVPQAKARK